MKYKPVYIEENVNVTKESPVKKTFVLLSWLMGIVIGAYLLLGLISDIVITNLPPQLEQKLGNIVQITSDKIEPSETETKIKFLLDELIAELPEKDQIFEYKLLFIKENKFNAFAAPGRIIGVYEGLYKETTEKELAFVLAHELGHHIHKDPLKAMSRRILASIVSMVIFGSDNLVNSMITGSVDHMNLNFSRNAEVKADLFAAQLIHKKYGDISGAVEFMEKIDKKQQLKLPKFVHYFSTHPPTEERKRLIEIYINNLN